MSIDFTFEKKVWFDELFDGRLEKYGIREKFAGDRTSLFSRVLTDGENYLWVYGEGTVSCMTSYYPNGNPLKILKAIIKSFNTDIYSEFEPQYWGYETQEEWDAAEEALNQQAKIETYTEIMKSIKGKPSNISPGTLGATWCKIAKQVISKDPSLAKPERMDDLMNTVHEGSIVKWEPPDSD